MKQSTGQACGSHSGLAAGDSLALTSPGPPFLSALPRDGTPPRSPGARDERGGFNRGRAPAHRQREPPFSLEEDGAWLQVTIASHVTLGGLLWVRAILPPHS